MISGDSTASHMGSVKNIEKARERRTFETMPGSSEAGVPDELLSHANTVHPRMGYDMSDSIFMQEQQAAGFSKEAKRAAEDRAALEAFRAAALQKPADLRSPLSVTPSGASSGDGDHKRKADRPPPPIAGIRLKKKSSLSIGSRGGSEAAAAGSGGGGGSSNKRDNWDNSWTDEDTPAGGDEGDGGSNTRATRENEKEKKKKKKKKKKRSSSSSSSVATMATAEVSSKNSDKAKYARESAESSHLKCNKQDSKGLTTSGGDSSVGDEDDIVKMSSLKAAAVYERIGSGAAGAGGSGLPAAGLASPAAVGGLAGLVAYSSGDDNDSDEDGA